MLPFRPLLRPESFRLYTAYERVIKSFPPMLLRFIVPEMSRFNPAMARIPSRIVTVLSPETAAKKKPDIMMIIAADSRECPETAT